MSTAPNVSVIMSAEDRGVTAAIKALTAQLELLSQKQIKVATSAREAAAAEQQFGESTHKARESAELLGESVDLKMGRSLRGILATSGSLGPALTAAFPIAAAIGFFTVIVEGAKKLTEFISEQFIYSKEAQESYQAEIDLNKKLLEIAKERVQLGRQLSLVGLDPLTAEKKKAEYAQQDVTTSEAVLKQKQAALAVAKQNLETAQATNEAFKNSALINAPGVGELVARIPFVGTEEEVKKAQTAYDALNREVGDLQQGLGKLKDQSAITDKTLAVDALKSAQAFAAAKDAQLVSSAQNELAKTTAKNQLLEAENQRAYETGKKSLAQYFNSRDEILSSETAAEMNVLRAQLRSAQGDLTRVRQLPPSLDRDTKEIAAADRVAKAKADIAAAEIRSQQKALDQDDQNRQTAQENAQKIIEFRQADLALQGKSADAAESKMQIDKQVYEQALAATGRTNEEIEAEVSAWERRRTLAAEFSETQKRVQAETSKFEAERKEAANIEEEQGPFSAAARANVEAMRAEIVQLTLDLARMRAEAIPGNAEQAKAIEDLKGKIEEMQRAVKQVDVGERIRKQFSGAVAQDIVNFFSTGIEQAHSFGDAMRSLAGSVVQSLQQILAQMIALQIQAMLMKALGVIFGGGVPLPGAGGGGGGGGPLGGFPGMFAAGGLVSGPGGPTEDRVPAMLSAGEFVMTAETVKALGAENLEMLNRAMRQPSTAPSTGTQHFAEGGIVGGGEGGGMDIALGLDEGLVIKHLKTKAGQRVILQALANNPKAATRALQRSQ